LLNIINPFFFIRVEDRPLQPLDGRREAPVRKRMVIRSTDGAARSVRAIDSRISRGGEA